MVLHAQGLTRRYGAHTPVRQVDLSVDEGEVFGLIGPNGGGKSTLLLLFAGLVQPSSGEVRVLGSPATHIAQAQQGTVGLITAEPGLYPLLTGWENLQFFGGLYGMDPEEVRTAAAPLLASLHLDEAMDRPSATYSSGMRQKVSLTRALLRRPRLLLLDEPTASLDPISTQTLHEAIRAQADAGVAVVLATHDLHAAEHICDRVGVMRQTLRGVTSLQGRRAAPPPSVLTELYMQERG